MHAREIDRRGKEVRVRTVAQTAFVLTDRNQLLSIAVTLDDVSNCVNPAGEHILRKQTIIERLQRPPVIKDVRTVKIFEAWQRERRFVRGAPQLL